MVLPLPLLLPFLLAASLGAQRVEDEAAEAPRRPPVGLHLSAYSTRLAARLDADGTFDTGALEFRLVGPDGAELSPRGMRYEPGPRFSSSHHYEFDGAFVVVRGVVMPARAGGDERVHLAVQLGFENPTGVERTVRVRGLAFPGGGGARPRPIPSLPYEPSVVFARDGEVLTRDGAGVLAWRGPAPAVALHPRPGAPDEPFATLDWTVTVPPGQARTAAVHLAGPPSADTVDEAAWRADFLRHSFESLLEMSRWQSDVQPTFTASCIGDRRLGDVMVASISCLRLLGEGYNVLEHVTDRPYNHPASDVAFAAEAVATFIEFGLTAFGVDLLRPLVREPPPELADLSPERRLAYAYNLVRAARLGDDAELETQLAFLVLELCADGDVAVPAYADPAIVREDMVRLLTRVDMGDVAAELPMFRWGEFDPGSTEGIVQTVRRALSDGRAVDAWQAFGALLDRSSASGFGGMDPTGEFDGRYPVHVMALVREMLVDDHGDDLHLFPGVTREMLPDTQRFKIVSVHSLYGGWHASMYWTFRRKARLGVSAFFTGGPRRAERIILHPPAPHRARKVQLAHNGEIDVLDDGTLLLQVRGAAIEGNVVLSPLEP